MSRFHNPYHFVPVKAGDRADDIPRGAIGGGHVMHDKYVSATSVNGQTQAVFSGRIICRLTTEDPIFIGSYRTELADKLHRVEPFELNGEPAIPASTLRGLISSVAEAASNSSMRVLEDRHYSYRMGMRDHPMLGALGMIVKDGQTSAIRLRPLALPALPWRNNGAVIPAEYRVMFTEPLLKVYVEGYQPRPGTHPPIVEQTPDLFLQRNNPDSYSADKQEYWYMKLRGTATLSGGRITCNTGRFKGNMLVGQQVIGDPISQAEYDTKPEDEKRLYTRGILRVLGVEGRDGHIPTGKKHEIFIPYPKEMETYPAFDVTEAAERFHALAADRTKAEKNLPFHLKGSMRNNENNADRPEIKLREGDIVFFNVTPQSIPNVNEIAISSIWRRSAGGSSHDYFKQISPEILPFNGLRESVTIGEQMFGFVEHRKKGETFDEPALALASRIRFSFALLDAAKSGHEPYYLPELLLKVLDAPKPPSPALYFKKIDGGGDYISKRSLNPNKHIPQGRKMYLHRQSNVNEPWKTLHPGDNLSQKNRITPLREGIGFYFHVDFENLCERELSLLCFSLRPFERYKHKIGMGKPIGLGRISIEPEGLFLVDRCMRYSQDSLFSTRYQRAWAKNGVSEAWPEKYNLEKSCAGIGGIDAAENIAARYKMDPDIKRALELLGDPYMVSYSVHTPQEENRDIEKETFRWFVTNDGGRNQFLRPINESSQELPFLEE